MTAKQKEQIKLLKQRNEMYLNLMYQGYVEFSELEKMNKQLINSMIYSKQIYSQAMDIVSRYGLSPFEIFQAR